MTDNESKILVLVSPELSDSQYLSLVALLKVIEINSQEIEILYSPTIANYEDLESLEEYSKLEGLAEQKYLLQFENQADKVSSIQWNQTDKNLNIYVSMDNGKLNTENITFDSVGGNYSTIYTFGLGSLDDLGDKYSKTREYIFSEAEIVSFGKEVKIKGRKVENRAISEDGSIAEEVYKYIHERKLKINMQAATDLLAAIYISTDNFKQVVNPDVFSMSAELVKADADTQKANMLVEKAKSIIKN